MPEEIFIVLVTAMVLGVPILGLTIRMVAKPMAEAIATLKDSFTGERHQSFDSMDSRRLMILEEEVDTLKKVVDHLAEVEEFQDALKASDTPEGGLLPPPSDG